MGSQRRDFTPEYKDEAVKLVVNTGRPAARVARELGVKEQTLGRWVNAYRVRLEAGDGVLTETERAELLRLRKEVSDLKLDRAFQKERHSSSPRKRRIRTESVRADAGGEDQLHGQTDGQTPRGVPVEVLCLAETHTVTPGHPGRTHRGKSVLVSWRVGRGIRVPEDPR